MFSKIKTSLEEQKPLDEKEISFIHLYKLDAEDVLLVNTVNDIMASLANKEKAINAYKNMLSDLVNYPLYQQCSDSLFHQSEDKVLPKEKDSDTHTTRYTTKNHRQTD